MRGTIKYHKELQKTYMIAEECKPEIVESYCGQMALRGKIKGLAACEVRLTDGEQTVWYNISFLQPLEQIYAVKEIGCREVKELLLQVMQVLRETEKYLLDARQLCFEPAFLYWNMEIQSVVFLFDFTELCEEKNPADTIGKLAAFLLERTSHAEEAAVDLVYHFYECTQRESFSLTEMEQYLVAEVPVAEAERQNSPEDIYGEDVGEESVLAAEDRTAAEKTAADQQDVPPIQTGTEGNAFSWSSKAGRWVEAGFVCMIMGILTGIALFMVQKGYVLGDGERFLAVGSAVGLFFAGIGAALYGWGVEKNEKSKTDTEKAKGNCAPVLFADVETEAMLWEGEREAGENQPTQEYEGEADGKTIYIGTHTRFRNYILKEIKKGAQREYPVTSYPFVIGKDKERVNLEVKEHSVSRIHARLLEEDGDIYLEDLHSTNGTCLNDIPLEPHVKMKLKRGDNILFGRAEFSFY